MGLIGSGGHGSCFLCKETKSDGTIQFYALKVINRDDVQEQPEKFEREINALETIDFPLVCSICGYSTFGKIKIGSFQENFPLPENDNPCILLDYIPGNNLYYFVFDCESDMRPDLLYIFSWGISYSLQQIHNKGIVHRDLSPGNVIIDGNYMPHIVDLGESSPDNRKKNK